MLLRYLLICCCFFKAIAGVIDLAPSEVSLYSENGEDGVIAALFREIGIDSRYFVDLGAGDGITHSNTYFLLLQGWDATSIDRTQRIPALSLYKEFITAENINRLFEKYQIPQNLDLLSIDIEYNTFHIWKALDPMYRPAIVVVAFNGTLEPDVDQVVHYHPFFAGDSSQYFGASALALYKLGRAKGYSLVYIEKAGSNLFFVRDDILKDKGLSFKNMNDVKALYHPSIVEYPVDPLGRDYISSDEASLR